MIDDRALTPNFTLYELTRTDRQEFQPMNRKVTSAQVEKLTEVAKLLEVVRGLIAAPLRINSGYRCKLLNDAIGSTDRSQHLLCEAADFVPLHLDLGEAFRSIWNFAKAGKIHFGQLIHETAERPGGDVSWIHISLGTPFRDASKCRQVLRMEHGKYTLLETIR